MEDEFFFPPVRSEYAAYVNNLYTQLLPIHTQFDITTAEMTVLQADRDALSFMVDRLDEYSTTASLYVNARNILWSGDPNNPNLELISYPKQPTVVTPLPATVAPNLYARLKSLVLRLRQHPNMTETTARLLGILPRPASNGQGEVPGLSGSVVNGQAALDCPLRGFAGYEIWKDVTGNNNFVLFRVSVGRFFTDNTQLPEGENAAMWSYKVRMLDANNQPVGAYSNMVALAVSRVI